MPFYTIAINQMSWVRAQARTMARGLNGRIWAVRQEGGAMLEEIWAAYSDDDGVTWTQEKVSTAAPPQTMPCIAIDSNNYVHVCWIGTIGGFEQIQYRRRTNVWEAIENVHPFVAADQGYGSPSIDIDSLDNIHVAWCGRGWGVNVGQCNIQYRERSAAGVWGAQVGLSDSARIQRGKLLAVGYDDTVYVAWTGEGLGTFPLRGNIYFRARVAGVWGAVEFITDRNESHRDPNLAVAPDGTVHACWDGTGYGTFPAKHQLAYRNRSPVGVWGAVDVLTDVTAVAQPCWAPSIALEKTGIIHIAWYGQGWGVNVGWDNIQHRARSVAGVWGTQNGLTDEPWDQGHCKLIYSVHPYNAVSGNSPGVPLTGYMFQYLRLLAWVDYSAVAFTSPAAWLLAPTVITNPATAISQVSATPNGTLDNDGGEACEVRFQYGLTDAYGTNTEWQLGKETDDTFQQAISGLEPNTTYHFRAQAKNSAGTASGADRTFTTLLAPVPLIINRAYALSREEL